MIVGVFGLALACGGEPVSSADGFEAGDFDSVGFESAGDESIGDESIGNGETATSVDGDAVLKARFAADSGCSTAQQRTINNAESVAIIELAAIELVADELVNDPSPVGLQQLQSFFGVASLADRRFVTDTYENILDFIVATDYICLEDGDPINVGDIVCGDASGANASTNRGTLTRLCPLFFESNNSIIQASTLIHELSHQTRTAPPPGVPTDDLTFASIHTAPSYGSYANKCLAQTCL
jgi:hypothetical protein